MSRDAYISGGLAHLDRLARRGTIVEAPARRVRRHLGTFALYVLALLAIAAAWFAL